MGRIECLAVVLLAVLSSVGSVERQARAGEPVTLETLRQRVASNEKLIDPIRLSYTVRFSRTGERPQPVGGMRRPGRSYSHYNVVWAQSGGRQYVGEQYFYGPNEPARGDVTVLDDGVRTQAQRREHIAIDSARNTDWYHSLAAKLRLRPFEDQHQLSEMLVSPHATLLTETETVAGRSACVVDITRPDQGDYVARLWIGADSGVPLRACVYAGHPAAPQARLVLEVNDVTPYRLPNGGWIPASGVRIIHGEGYASCERVTVDVNSITVRPDDVPDSLFRLDPPEGGTVYNAFTGLTTVRGSESKTYGQIVNGAGKSISGVVVDAGGAPVPGTIVAPSGITMSQTYKLIQPYERCCAVTDAQGRFALELEEEGRYELEFYSAEFVDKELRDIPLGEHDLKVVLDRGGAVTGRVFFVAGGRKAPLADASVYVRAGDRLMDARMRPIRKETMTDDEGRFEFKCLPTQMRDRSIASSELPRYVPLPWQISCGSVSESVLFQSDGDRREIELLLKPDIRSARPLTGRPLPDLAGLGLEVAPGDVIGRRVLLCFFDTEQRPARNCVEELARRAASLRERDVAVRVVHEKGIETDKLRAWAKEAGVAFPVGIITGDSAEVKYAWAVRSLPWLILTDKDHKVLAEGFDVNKLDEMIGTDAGKQP